MKTFSHPFAFDPTYGFDLPKLMAVTPPEPFPEFEAFWRETYRLAREAERSKPERRRSRDGADGHEVYDVSFRSFDGRQIGGWLAVPTAAAPQCAIVQGHGYGGSPGFAIAAGAIPAIRLFYCTRGFHRSAAPDLPDVSSKHVIHRIHARDEYILRGSAADLWAAVGALLEWAPEFAGRLYYSGRSFGGGIGSLAVPWDERISRCYLGQPTFGNYPFRLSVPCRGSGEAVRLHRQSHPEVVDVLRYYDAAVAASYLRIPTLVSCSVFDPAVPPPGQFSVYNAITAKKELFVEPAGHFPYPEAAANSAALQRRINAWFGAPDIPPLR